MYKRVHIIFFISLFGFFLFLKPVYSHTNELDDFQWFWMFYEKDITKTYTSETYRPFYLKRSSQLGIYEASLMPILFWRYNTERTDNVKALFGLYESVSYTHKTGIRDYDINAFPFFMYGDSIEKQDQYLMLWPIGGTFKGKFGFEEVNAWGFPWFLLFIIAPPASFFSFTTTIYAALSMLPVYMDYKYKDYKGWSLFWPLFHRGKSSKRDELRILPFYSRIIKKGWYEKYSYMFLVNYSKTYFLKDILETLFVLPFYGHKRSQSGRRTSTTILWPFFSWGYDKKTNDRIINMPWPFVQIRDSKKPRIRSRIFFPFYGSYKYERNKTFFITPLYFVTKSDSAVLKAENYTIGVIFWYYKREYSKPDKEYGSSWRYFKIWPLFHVEYNDRGEFEFNLLSILPFRDSGGYEKMYQPFWSLFEYKKLKNGEKRLGVLMRLYFQRWNKNFLQIKVPFLLSYESFNDKITELDFLFYMFGYSNTVEGKYIRLFWIPIKIGKGDSGRVVKENSYDNLSTQDIMFALRNNHTRKKISNVVHYSLRF